MQDHELRELWIVSKEMERPPYWFAEEGLNARLIKALRVVQEGRITPNSDGSVTVRGTGNHTYRVREHCPCPDTSYRPSRPCYHQIAVTLYIEWQRRLGLTPQGLPRTTTHPDGTPVDDETLPLALGPHTIEERLAAVPAPTMPQEARMPIEESEYLPEPEVSTTAVIDAKNGMSHDTPLATPLASALVQWSAQRQVVKEFLRRELHDGVDFYTLQIRGKATKPSLSKAGAEKFLGLLQLQASFAPDLGTWEMLGKPTDQILYVCQLRTRSGEIVGEGRGARSIKQDGGDLNKAMKMASKSSLIDAVLRTGALSEVFTQDREPEDSEEPAKPARPSSSDLRSRIWGKVKEAYPHITRREDCEAYIKDVCGLDLTPDNYQAILTALGG